MRAGEVGDPHPQAGRLGAVRELARSEPARGQALAWEWMTSLSAHGDREELAWLFAQGEPPAPPGGDCEGQVLGLFGTPFMRVVDTAVKLGRALGGIGWTGKTFDSSTERGYNRLTATARLPMQLAMPRYRFGRAGGEITGFRFDHRIERSPVAPHTEVRSVNYADPAYGNPLMLPDTRDELVEIVPRVLLGRALLRDGEGWRVVAYFALREPVGGLA